MPRNPEMTKAQLSGFFSHGRQNMDDERVRRHDFQPPWLIRVSHKSDDASSFTWPYDHWCR